MSRARVLANRANQNTLAVETDSIEVGISSTSPRSTLDIRGEVQVGTAIQAGVAGVITATSFSGSGSNLTGVANTDYVVSVATTTGDLKVSAAATITGVANFSSTINADATTDSTSTSTGALIVDGGVGIAKNVYIGAGLSVAGTLTYEDVTSVDSVGLITASSFVGDLTGAVSGTTGSFSGDLDIAGDMRHIGDANTKIGFPADDTINFQTAGSERLRIDASGNVGINEAGPDGYGPFVVKGTGNIVSLNASSGAASLSFFENGTGRFYVKTLNGSDGLSFIDADNSSERLRITPTGGFSFSNGLFDEKVNITAGKLTDNNNINLANGMVHYFTTQESTTSLVNIRVDGSNTLQDAMDTGDVCTVTVIVTAAAAGYFTNWQIDNNAVTEEWVGGEAPSAGGDDGLDIYTLTIICIGTGTGDSGFKVIANLTNASN